MGSNVDNGGIEQHQDGMLTAPSRVVEIPVTDEEARLVNGMLDAAGFKGSDAKQVAADMQRKLEIAFPELLER